MPGIVLNASRVWAHVTFRTTPWGYYYYSQPCFLGGKMDMQREWATCSVTKRVSNRTRIQTQAVDLSLDSHPPWHILLNTFLFSDNLSNIFICLIFVAFLLITIINDHLSNSIMIKIMLLKTKQISTKKTHKARKQPAKKKKKSPTIILVYVLLICVCYFFFNQHFKVCIFHWALWQACFFPTIFFINITLKTQSLCKFSNHTYTVLLT